MTQRLSRNRSPGLLFLLAERASVAVYSRAERKGASVFGVRPHCPLRSASSLRQRQRAKIFRSTAAARQEDADEPLSIDISLRAIRAAARAKSKEVER
jgi:hypothetical protein